MKTVFAPRWAVVLFLHSTVCLWHFPAHAVLPEPDNVLFGTITRDGALVTAADYDVVVEVRRTPVGPAIASYTMGSSTRLGYLYSVRVKLESLTPILDTNATQTNDQVYLVVTDFNGVLYSTNVVVGPRGTFRQINLGPVPSDDSDNDGLPDAWELAVFGHLGNSGGTINVNGQSTVGNFVSGANPNDPNGVFRLSIARSGPNKFVSFFARQSAGAGYEGYVRSYALEYTTNLTAIQWFNVPNHTNIPGNNATFSYRTTEPGTNVFYRGQVRLRRP